MKMNKNEFIKELINKQEPKNKGITIKMTNSDYTKIKNWCNQNRVKMSDLLNIKIKEILELIS